MDKGIAITGIGVSSPFGTTPAEIWDGFNVNKPETDVEKWNAGKRSEDDFFTMGKAAVERAVTDSGADPDPKRTCLLVGSGMGLADALLGQSDVPDDFLAGGFSKLAHCVSPKIPVQYMGNACCAGAQAVAYACDLIKAGEYDTVIAGGIDAFSYIAYSGFKRLCALDPKGCRPFDRNRKGISVGEGAAFFVFQHKNIRRVRGRVLGCGVTNDAYHVVSPEPSGTQASRAILLALEKAGLTSGDIDAVVAHGTGTKQNDALEARILYSLFGRVKVTAPKGLLGHTGGASGAFNLLTALECLKRQALPPIKNLLNEDEDLGIHLVRREEKCRLNYILADCFAFGGTNTAILCGN